MYKRQVLYSFSGGADGATPYAALISDVAGNLYGTTSGDSTTGNGNVFMLSPSATTPWPITVLHSFSGPDGEGPRAAVVADAAGNLYGTALLGGGSGSGDVFMLTRSATAPWPTTVLYSFTGGTDGGLPQAPLILDAGGNLYGTTTKGAGTVFMLTRSAATPWPETVLYSFGGGADGADPNGLIADATGNLYSTTIGGGIGCGVSGCGTIFMLTRAAKAPWPKTLLYSFTGGNDGSGPQSGLVADSGGNFYGTTYSGGPGGGGISPSGVVYKLTPAANAPWPQSVLYSFTGRNDGGNPYDALLIDTSGAMYGTTVYGGTSNSGTVFKLVSTPQTCTDNSGGTVPLGGKQFVPCPQGQVGTPACPSVSPVVGPGLPDCGTETCVAQNTWSSPDFSMCGEQSTCTDNSGVIVPLGGKQFVACPQGQVGTTACPSLSSLIGPGLPNCATETCQAQNTWSMPPDSSLCDVPCTDNGKIFPVGATESRNCLGGQSGTQTQTCNAGGQWSGWTGACQCPAGQLLCFNGLTQANQCFTPLGGITDNSGVFHAWCGHEDSSEEIDCGSSCPAGSPCGPAINNPNHVQTTDMYCGDGTIGSVTGGGSDVALLTFLALMAVWSIPGVWHLRRRASR